MQSMLVAPRPYVPATPCRHSERDGATPPASLAVQLTTRSWLRSMFPCRRGRDLLQDGDPSQRRGPEPQQPAFERRPACLLLPLRLQAADPEAIALAAAADPIVGLDPYSHRQE